VPRHKRSILHLSLASSQERCQVRLADSIVMYPRGSAAVCGVNVVSRIVVVSLLCRLPVICHWPWNYCCMGISVCVSLSRFGRHVFGETSKQPATDF